MTVWLNKQQIADILGIHVKTAEKLMMEMHPVPISGNVRKRYRVSEQNLENWMLKHGGAKSVPNSKAGTGTTRKLQRR